MLFLHKQGLLFGNKSNRKGNLKGQLTQKSKFHPFWPEQIKTMFSATLVLQPGAAFTWLSRVRRVSSHAGRARHHSSWLGSYSGYFDYKHGVNVAVSRQMTCDDTCSMKTSHVRFYWVESFGSVKPRNGRVNQNVASTRRRDASEGVKSCDDAKQPKSDLTTRCHS